VSYNFPNEPETRVSDIFFRTIAGLFGGGFGSLVLLIGVLLSGSFASSYLTAIEGGGVHPVFTFAFIAIVYLSLLVSALASVTFFYYCDRDRYKFLFSTLSHVFAVSTLIFVVSTPLSLLLAVKDFDSLSLVALVLMGITVVFSIIIMEVVANHKHLLLTLYSTTLSLFTFFILMLGLYIALDTTTFLLPLALPICWASFGFWQVAFEMSYQFVYQSYGTDFLNSSTRLGSDYIKEQRLKRQ
jgi:hypothetical protein